MRLISLLLSGCIGGPTPPVVLSEQAQRGRATYLQACATCHQVDGNGLSGAFPPLAGSEWLEPDDTVPIRIVLNGLKGSIRVAGKKYDGLMLAHRDLLSDQQIADVLTYVRADWGNQGAPISAATVAQVRAETADRDTPWTADTLR
jgi:mono/diheme cytochrome c family protein